MASAVPRQGQFETIVDIFRYSIPTFAARPLFGVKKSGLWKWTTYREFGKLVDSARRGLAEHGVGKGDKVAIIANNRVEWAVAAYATYGRAAAFVPMYEQQPEKDWEYMVKDSETKVLFVATTAIYQKIKYFLGAIATLQHIVVLEEGFAPEGEERASSFADLLGLGDKSADKEAFILPAKTDVAGFIYTSGTTGTPKGVILSHSNIASNVSAVEFLFPVTPEDRSLSFLPWAHSFGQTCELHVLISRGASMGLAESVEKIIDNLAEVKPTLLFSVPRIFNKLYTAVQKQLAQKPPIVQRLVRSALRAKKKQRNGRPLSPKNRVVIALTDKLVFSKVRARFGGRLRYAFSGGAAISTEVAEFIDSLGVTVYEGYGLTETSPIATANSPGHRRIGSVGRAIPHVRVEIDTSAGGGEKNGYKEGEIVIYGPNIMVGYHNRPEENAAVFTSTAPASGGPGLVSPPQAGVPPEKGFRTGDMGYVDSEGYVYITGRIKEQYKLENGKYVVPTPLEEELKLSPYIANVMVYGDNKPFNVALIVANVDAVKSWADKAGVAASGAALLAHEKVRALLKGEVERLSSKFKGFESVREFAVIDQDFTQDNGMLTPSMKLKRRNVLEVHGPLLDGLYGKKARPAEAAASAA
jgi:long-chain acyl-CoA synthetase